MSRAAPRVAKIGDSLRKAVPPSSAFLNLLFVAWIHVIDMMVFPRKQIFSSEFFP